MHKLESPVKNLADKFDGWLDKMKHLTEVEETCTHLACIDAIYPWDPDFTVVQTTENSHALRENSSSALV